MSENFNQFSCICRLTKDVEIKEVGEHKVGVSSIAVNGRKDTDVLFMDIKVWNKQAEILQQYTSKGSKIQLTGKLSLEKWEKDGVKHQRIICNVQSFEFLDSKKDSTETHGAQRSSVQDSFNGTKVDNPFDASDLTF
jgi:single-strand DNA-binding protein